jgi:hypothetical protein
VLTLNQVLWIKFQVFTGSHIHPPPSRCSQPLTAVGPSSFWQTAPPSPSAPAVPPAPVAPSAPPWLSSRLLLPPPTSTSSLPSPPLGPAPSPLARALLPLLHPTPVHPDSRARQLPPPSVGGLPPTSRALPGLPCARAGVGVRT